jgi:hypothetical protein
VLFQPRSVVFCSGGPGQSVQKSLFIQWASWALHTVISGVHEGDRRDVRPLEAETQSTQLMPATCVTRHATSPALLERGDILHAVLHLLQLLSQLSKSVTNRGPFLDVHMGTCTTTCVHIVLSFRVVSPP